MIGIETDRMIVTEARGEGNRRITDGDLFSAEASDSLGL